MSMGAKIANARKQQNITQEQLAMLLGVTRQSVSRWESDAAYPEVDKIIKLAEVLQINCDYLLRGEDAESGETKVPTTPVTRLLKSAAGKRAMIQSAEDDNSASYKGIIQDFDGAWATVEIFRGKKSETKLIPVSSISAITFLKEKE